MGVDSHTLHFLAAESLQMVVVGHYSELDTLSLCLYYLLLLIAIVLKHGGYGSPISD